jgi:5-methylcytosine-specific restriction endonuclease McrA
MEVFKEEITLKNSADELYFYKKEVDWSLLNEGINIPVSLQNVFYQNTKLYLQKGDKKKISLVIDGIGYQATLTNINFDETKYPNCKEILQIRYLPSSAIVKKLRYIFHSSFSYITTQRELSDNKREHISVPINNREYVAMYLTNSPDTFVLECITQDEISVTQNLIKDENEMYIEQLLAMQDHAAIFTQEKTVKIRRLDKSISDRLKEIYNYQCQICGKLIDLKYNAIIAHSHHIDYFSKSLNNNANNILIVCPNHHSIIHATNPIFNRKTKQYSYPNGLIEGLKLNYHL